MKFKKQLIGAATGCLLMGASNVMAEEVNPFIDIWAYSGVQSSSGTVGDTLAGEPYLLDPADPCMDGVSALRDLGFTFKAATKVEARLNAMYFEKSDDAAVLFCRLVLVEPTP